MALFSRLTGRRAMAYQASVYEAYFADMEGMYRQMRAWRHNWRGHLQAMKAIAAGGDMAALNAYLKQLETDLNAIEPAVRTGNTMADAILNSKISLARSKGVAVRADARIPVALSIPAVDLCVILGNLFDNAIEASLPLPEEGRMIRVYMDMKGTQLYISFTNLTATKKQKKENGRFASAKGAGHGVGLRSVDQAVNRLGGYLSRNSEDGAFTTEILLPQL